MRFSRCNTSTICARTSSKVIVTPPSATDETMVACRDEKSRLHLHLLRWGCGQRWSTVGYDVLAKYACSAYPRGRSALSNQWRYGECLAHFPAWILIWKDAMSGLMYTVRSSWRRGMPSPPR